MRDAATDRAGSRSGSEGRLLPPDLPTLVPPSPSTQGTWGRLQPGIQGSRGRGRVAWGGGRPGECPTGRLKEHTRGRQGKGASAGLVRGRADKPPSSSLARSDGGPSEDTWRVCLQRPPSVC